MIVRQFLQGFFLLYMLEKSSKLVRLNPKKIRNNSTNLKTNSKQTKHEKTIFFNADIMHYVGCKRTEIEAR